jgi:hypothetical protein
MQNYNYVCDFVCVCNFALALWDEHRPRVFKIRVLKKIFGPERVEVRGVVKNEEV